MAQQACTLLLTFLDENSESESDSDDRFKGEAWLPKSMDPFPALAVGNQPSLLCTCSSNIPEWPRLERRWQAGYEANRARSSRGVHSYSHGARP